MTHDFAYDNFAICYVFFNGSQSGQKETLFSALFFLNTCNGCFSERFTDFEKSEMNTTSVKNVVTSEYFKWNELSNTFIMKQWMYLFFFGSFAHFFHVPNLRTFAKYHDLNFQAKVTIFYQFLKNLEEGWVKITLFPLWKHTLNS